MTFEQYLRESALDRESLDRFLDPKFQRWARFDPELGYTLGNSMPTDGMKGSLTISTVQPNGARTSCVYAKRPCRINTYGDSFTQCHQVNDHETWQEYLAAHLGEPIRNFGVGGYGVNQAYRRMVRTEKGLDGAEYVILYIWGDDHYRSLLRCRHVLTHFWWKQVGSKMPYSMLHGLFWSNLEMDLASEKFIQREGLIRTPEALYNMTNPDFMVESLHDDWMLMMSVFLAGHIQDVNRPVLNKLAGTLGCNPITEGSVEELRAQVSVIRDTYAFSATKHLIDRSVEFTESCGKKLMIVLFWPRITKEMIATGKRLDEPVVNHLRERGIRRFDMNLVHVEDYKSYRIPVEDYMKRYLMGHYNPSGNHFFAFAIRDCIVQWLNPKPVTYRRVDEARVSFEGYLPDET